MHTVWVRPNPTKDAGLAVTAGILDVLRRQGFEPLVDSLLRPALLGRAGAVFAPAEEALARCDFILVVGGDGSILSVAAQAAAAGKPILGVNAGTLGFMSELEVSDLELIGCVKQGNFTLDRRAMLDVSVVDACERTRFSTVVLNEAAVNKGVISKAVGLTVRVDGEETVTFRGDGVLVATPTGSTAYSLAAGGPILAPSSPCMAVTPICPLSLSVRSFVIDWDSRVVIEPQYGSQGIYLSPDGFESHLLSPGERVVVSRAAVSLQLIRLKGQGFYQRIRMKLSR